MEIKEKIKEYKKEIEVFESYADLYEVYDSPILYIGYNIIWGEYDLHINYRRAVPSYIDIVKVYEENNLNLEEIIQDLKEIREEDPYK